MWLRAFRNIYLLLLTAPWLAHPENQILPQLSTTSAPNMRYQAMLKEATRDEPLFWIPPFSATNPTATNIALRGGEPWRFLPLEPREDLHTPVKFLPIDASSEDRDQNRAVHDSPSPKSTKWKAM